MHRFIGLILVVAATLGAGSQAAVAAPVVTAGSNYSFYLQGSESDGAFAGVTTFDDEAAMAVRGDSFLTVSESESDLGNGRSLISIQIRSTNDLFPVLGETAILGIGLFDYPLELMSVVNLYEARISFLDSNDKLLIETDNLADGVYQNHPWDGFFPATDDAFGTEQIGGLGVLGINFDFFVSTEPTAVPEPAGVLLIGLGFMTLLTTRRRRLH
ncbi:PEP-CTERM sorting domain-containing protein [Massilia timonae]|uniref:PEP-CTERM sorting domain-containing protein n=1 Tax=Massilia timonae TaxID=47229 RepID=UPI00289A7CCA|nr:PEP-CTERM sorting domain-containing protein [Massilia timonae]